MSLITKMKIRNNEQIAEHVRAMDQNILKKIKNTKILLLFSELTHTFLQYDISLKHNKIHELLKHQNIFECQIS